MLDPISALLILMALCCVKPCRATEHLHPQHAALLFGGRHDLTAGQQSASIAASHLAGDTVFTRAALHNHPQTKPVFDTAMFTATANLILFGLRPDSSMHWFARVPRLVWELSVLFVAKGASSTISPSLYMLLLFMTLPTALVDIFVWAPIYAHSVSFESCKGGWFSSGDCYPDPMKGYGRMAVSIQSVVGGLLYLMTAIQAWSAFVAYRDEQKVIREHRMKREWDRTERLLGSR